MIYMALNTVNCKYYIGRASDLERRKKNHKTRAANGHVGLFYDAIREHGFDAFEWFVLSSETTSRRESEIIRSFKADDSHHGYNVNQPRFLVTDQDASQATDAAFNAAFAKV